MTRGRVPDEVPLGFALLSALFPMVPAGCVGGPVDSPQASRSSAMSATESATPSAAVGAGYLGLATGTQGVLIDDTGLYLTRDGGRTRREASF